MYFYVFAVSSLSLHMNICVYMCGKHNALPVSTLVVYSSKGVEQKLSSDTPIRHSEAGSSLK